MGHADTVEALIELGANTNGLSSHSNANIPSKNHTRHILYHCLDLFIYLYLHVPIFVSIFLFYIFLAQEEKSLTACSQNAHATGEILCTMRAKKEGQT